MRARLRSRPALALVGVVALVVSIWVVVNSAIFDLDRIVVRGARSVPIEDVRRLAAVQPNVNLIRLSLDDVERRIEEDARIAQAAASRDLPSTLVLEIAERRPVAWLEQPDGVVVVSEDGIALELSPAAPAGLPNVGSLDDAVEVGDRIEDPPPAVRALASMSTELLGAIESASGEPEDIVLALRDGGEVLYGDLEGTAAKNLALEGMLDWVRERAIDVESVDVRVPEAPTLLPVGAAEPVPSPSPNP